MYMYIVLQSSIAFNCCREINESNLLLKEKIESLNAKLERSEQRNREMVMVEVENEVSRVTVSHQNLQKQ